MEDELQAGEDGFYCVGFKNVFALRRHQVEAEMSQFGVVHSVRGNVDGIDTRGWTFVRFTNPEEAVRAITGLRASPHVCDVNFVKYVLDSRRRGGRGRDGPGAPPPPGSGVSPLVRGDDPPERSPVRPPAEEAPRPPRRARSGQFEVFVGNWPLALEEDDLYGLFAKFDIKAVSVRLYKKEEKSYAFVVVSSAEDVERAIEQLNRGKVAGRQIVVKDSRNSFAKQQSPAPQKSQDQQPEPEEQPEQEPHHQQQAPRENQREQQHAPRYQQRREQQPPAGRQQLSVRQRLGGPARDGGGSAARGPRPQSEMPPLVLPPPSPAPGLGPRSQPEMPPLVLPPPEPTPPPLSAPFRAPGGYSRPEPFNGLGDGPARQYNGAGDRQPRADTRFERHPRGDTRFERQPRGDTRFERQPRGDTRFERRPARYDRERAPSRFERETAPRPFEREPVPRPFEREPVPRPFEREPAPRPFEREPAPRPFEREPAPAPFAREPAPAPFERGPAPIRLDREPEVRFERGPAPIRLDREPEALFERRPPPTPREREPEVRFEHRPELESPRGAFAGGSAGAHGPRTRPPPTGPPPVGPPPLSGLGARRYSQRPDVETDLSEPFVKRSRFGEPEPAGPVRLPAGPPPLAGLGPPPRPALPPAPHRVDLSHPPPLALRSSVAISERIKSRLHAPMDVVAANFPVGTNEHDLMQLFERFEPLNVRIMVNNSSQHPDDFTYAYITLSSRMMADDAVMQMDGLAFQGRTLVVETRKN